MATPLQRASHRVRQAYYGSFGRVDARVAREAVGELPANLRPLFLSMRPRDQRHAIGVLQRLGPAPAMLRQAALLHDVGKARAFLGTPGRTLVVLAAATRTTALLTRLPWIGRRVVLYIRHPEIGAEMVREAGGPEVLAEIVAEHQVRPPAHPETVRLQDADSSE